MHSKEHSARRPDGSESQKVKPLNKRSCKVCRKRFQPTSAKLVALCSYDLQVEYALRKVKKDRENAAKAERKRIAEEKVNMKTLTDWKRDFQKVINSIARFLDTGKLCLIRPNENVKKFDASHFYSIGSAPHLRFSVKNVYLSGTKSNRDLGGESLLMRHGLVLRYGIKWVDEIDVMFYYYSGVRLRIEDMKEKIKIARKVLRELKDGKEMTRHEIDLRIGIYDKHF